MPEADLSRCDRREVLGRIRLGVGANGELSLEGGWGYKEQDFSFLLAPSTSCSHVSANAPLREAVR